MLLIVSGDVELNPGPFKKCLKYETLVPNKSISVNVDLYLESVNKQMIQM